MTEQPVKESIFFKQKRERIQKVQAYMKSVKKIKYEKLQAMIVIMLGTSTDTAREYIHLLRDAEYVKIENGEVSLNDE